MKLFIGVITGCFLVTLAGSEPPAPGYRYQPQSHFRQDNSNSYTAPRDSYLPPQGYPELSESYLPPTYDSYSNQEDSYSNYNNDHHNHDHGHDDQVPKSYEFGYSVKDAASGNDYDRRESSDGNEVRGEYRVLLPDGRTQIVTYHADWKTGFHADVKYEGEARYPEPTYNTQQQGYSYNAPEFSGSLRGFSQYNNKVPSTQYGPPAYH